MQCAFRCVGIRARPRIHDQLEGVRHIGYSTILMGGMRDPYILSQYILSEIDSL